MTSEQWDLVSDAIARWVVSVLGEWLSYGLFIMCAVPFAVWAGRSVYGALASGDRTVRRPGYGQTFWLLVLPAAVIAYGLFRGFDVRDGLEYWQDDERGQLLFLLTSPCCGMIAGYVLGLIAGRGFTPSDHA